jgi:hypothetical protein
MPKKFNEFQLCIREKKKRFLIQNLRSIFLEIIERSDSLISQILKLKKSVFGFDSKS